MAIRRTAYVTRSHAPAESTTTDDTVTVDLYVLWPEGQNERARELLAAAVAELHHRIECP